MGAQPVGWAYSYPGRSSRGHQPALGDHRRLFRYDAQVMADPPVIDYRAADTDTSDRPRTRWWFVCGAGVLAVLLVTFVVIIGQLGNKGHYLKLDACASNLRQIAQAIELYRNSHQIWPQTLGQMMIGGNLGPDCFVCPAGNARPASGLTVQQVARTLTDPKRNSYIYYPPPANAGNIDPETILVVERPANHEGEHMNVLLADGYVECYFLNRPEGKRLLDEIKAGRHPPPKR